MNIELPEKFKAKNIECSNGRIIIHRPTCFESLMYNATKALKGHKCVYCGKDLKRGIYTLDHRYPRDTGGISITDNLCPCCESCNSDKGNLTHEEYMKIKNLSKKDRQPILNTIHEKNEELRRSIGFNLPKSWVSYFDISSIKYAKPNAYTKGKRFKELKSSFDTYGKIPRPIIADANCRLLDGYNVILLAEETNIPNIPVVKLDNIVISK